MTIDVDDLIAGQLLALLVGVVISLCGVAWRRARIRRGARKLWQLGSPNQLAIAISDSGTVHTGDYLRPMTGLGQVTSVGLLTPSLARAYKDLPPDLVRFATDCGERDVRGDLVILGGPKTNCLTAQLFEALPESFPVRMTVANGTEIHWSGPTVDAVFPGGAARPDTIGGKDFGIILRLPNVFDDGQGTITLFAGVHTYGTLAAAWHFAHRPKKLTAMAAKTKPFAVLVTVDVGENSRPLNPRVLDDMSLDEVPRRTAPLGAVTSGAAPPPHEPQPSERAADAPEDQHPLDVGQLRDVPP